LQFIFLFKLTILPCCVIDMVFSSF